MSSESGPPDSFTGKDSPPGAALASTPGSIAQPHSARAERLNRWLTLGANVGVIVGLLILIVEVRQNADLTRAQMESGRNDLLAQIELSLATPDIGAAWVKSIRAPESLTDVEVRTVESHLVAVMLQLDHMFNMEKIGLVSREEARRHVQNVVPYYFGSRHGKNWWRWQEGGWDGTPMMEVAGPIVDAVDENFMLRYLDGSRLGRPPDERSYAPEPDDIEREAQHFMERYAADLRRHDRAAVAQRYDRDGATVIFNGERNASTFDEIVARYRDQWIGPVSFEWQDLAFQVLGPDTVIVTCEFDWGAQDGIERYSYSGILQRQEGELRIRLEVESLLGDSKDAPP
ncbi:MAG: nuclear transport factor 2 family protein [Pseudomonadota bacterium]|nr:MAG: nuclear transport factor 2 family protein [Pseudomonadota bacterium]